MIEIESMKNEGDENVWILLFKKEIILIYVEMDRTK